MSSYHRDCLGRCRRRVQAALGVVEGRYFFLGSPSAEFDRLKAVAKTARRSYNPQSASVFHTSHTSNVNHTNRKVDPHRMPRVLSNTDGFGVPKPGIYLLLTWSAETCLIPTDVALHFSSFVNHTSPRSSSIEINLHVEVGVFALRLLFLIGPNHPCLHLSPLSSASVLSPGCLL